MEVSEQLTGFELEDLMSWTVSNLQRPFREDFSLQKSGIIAEKESQIFGRRFVGFDRPKKRRPFSISKRALEDMTAMEAAPQLKASGLDGDYRILADFGGTVLAGTPSKHGVQFVTWDWDYDCTGVSHGHYFMENYDAAKRDFATRSGLIQKEQLFSPEQLTEIFRCCADSVDEDFFELTDKQEEMIRGIQQQIRVCVPDMDERVRQQEEALERASQEQTM